MQQKNISKEQDYIPERKYISGGLFVLLFIIIIAISGIVLLIIESSKPSPEMKRFYEVADKIASMSPDYNGSKDMNDPSLLPAVYVFATLFISLIFGMLCISLADKKGYNTYRYFWLGFFLWIIGLLYVIGLPIDEKSLAIRNKAKEEQAKALNDDKINMGQMLQQNQEKPKSEYNSSLGINYPTGYDYQRKRRSSK
jgi:hypothetical protein